MQIGLASPDKIRSWSYGEVKKPETINYRTLKPERDGLFCERIFGPSKDWECACGKYKRIRYKGIVCDRCGVEVTRSKVRRERMGHIELAAPVSHIWYFKGIPSRMGLVLDMSPRALEEIIYFASYVVIEPGDTPLEKKQLLTEREYREKRMQYGQGFQAAMGAEAIKQLLLDVQLEKEVAELKEELKSAQGQKRTRAIRRLDILEAFRNSGNDPSWMVMDVVPIIPPDLRPMVQLEGGRFATSDLNDLYRRVINRNNRLKRLLDLNAPNIIVQNEKRMLQEAVDALIDNGRRGRPVTGPGNRPLKSLSHMLKGKQGRFRQNLLGKRVDYSGRSVIVVGPNLKMYQCGLPKEMAIELFKPFVMKELVERELANNIKNAKRKIDRQDEAIWDVLEDVIREHPVLLNRAPTLHRLGIQAFEPILVDGRAIRLHPLVCEAYNADFDGDQMAVHVPLSDEAQAEARMLMLAAQNILNPKDGKPVVTPSQDMVLGNYYLTMEEEGREGEGMVFKDLTEAITAYQSGYVHMHSRIGVQTDNIYRESNHPIEKPFSDWQKERILITTVGKLLFNEIMPPEFPYLNEPTNFNLEDSTPDKYFVEAGTDIPAHIKKQDLILPFKKKNLGNIIAEVFKKFHITETSKMLDRMKDLGYKHSTRAGITVGIADIVVLHEKQEVLDDAHNQVDNVTKQFRRGLITDEERYERVIAIWNKAKDTIQIKLMESLDAKNPIFMMSDSGARGNISNFTQLAGMRGLMAAPNGQIMELPITSNFREGLSVLEMFISTHGARKGMTDTALKTADSGYLTRRLVDVAQDVIIRETDCGTDRGLDIAAIKEGNEVIEPLEERLLGRYIRKTVFHPETGKKIITENNIITEDIAKEIIDAGIEKVTIRSVFTCNTKHGVCKHCYGRNLATGSEVEVGEAVGTIAAQSIGEPGTQLTMRTFHTGGVAGDDITQGLPRIQEIFEARNPKGQAVITEVTGEVIVIEENAAERTKEVTIKGATDTRSYPVPYTARLKVVEGDYIHRGEALTEGSIDPKQLLRVRDVLSVENYLLREVQKVYRMQGVEIGDKHIEVMVRQMLRKIRVMDPGSTDILPGTLMDISEFTDKNLKTLVAGDVPATGRPVLLGITKASLETNSFLSAASFQETTRVLTDAAIRGKRDPLLGLKENVIIGKIIPAGTGMAKYRNMEPKSIGVVSENVYSINDTVDTSAE
ncbi:DNA-directed RNA polymerase subunit beta [Carnobacterium maltaromaticum]|jgi:DNA-directed RNA polymerase subunit beta'|nr:DNA-directed RNA polymerase subunit beta [Carnobacterium maltaromaticum]KRN86541.1 DNA-directed RNA polymerase subunit beta [Carnobacterium maltaromaticum]